MKNEIIEYILMLLRKKRPIERESDIENLRYLETGHVDSLGFMKFIVEIEEKFCIEICEDDMMKDEFFSIGGLVEIIVEKIEKNREDDFK